MPSKSVLRSLNRGIKWSYEARRYRSTADTVSSTGVNFRVDATDNEFASAKPLEDVPGPKPLPLIGNIWRFVPYVGELGGLSLNQQLEKLRGTYGDIVKLEGIFSRRPCIFLFDAELCEKMYRMEGQWPSRVAMESLKYYRSQRPEIFNGLHGLILSQDKSWHDFRSKVNQHMMQPRSINPHINNINEIADDFIVRLRQMRDSTSLELPVHANNEFSKWALESIGSIALDHRFGCLEPNLPPDSEGQVMIQCVSDMFDLLYKLEVLPSLWKRYNTKNLRKLFDTLDNLNRVATKYIDIAKERCQKNSKEGANGGQQQSVLEKLLSIDDQVAKVMALDMMTAGIDTTSNTTGTWLYYLSVNKRAQERLREEARSVLPEKSSPVTTKTLSESPYLKACLKESMRLSPLGAGNLRTMTRDVVLGGYRIPKDYDVVAIHGMLSRDPKNFSQPNEYVPERWLRSKSTATTNSTAPEPHAFAYMPFGFGPRSCIGRRFAELEMLTLTIKMIRNFEIEWHHEPIEYSTGLINTIKSPLQFKLIDVIDK